MQNSENLLSLEQQFKVRMFETQIQDLPKDDLLELMVDLYENSLVQQKLFEKLMGEQMGLFQGAS